MLVIEGVGPGDIGRGLRRTGGAAAATWRASSPAVEFRYEETEEDREKASGREREK